MNDTLNLLQWNIDLSHKDHDDDFPIIKSRIEILNNLISKYSPNIVALQEADYRGIKDAFPHSLYDFYIDGGLVTAYKKDYWFTPSIETKSSRYVILRLQSIDSKKPDLLFTHIHAQSHLYGGKENPETSLTQLNQDLYNIRCNPDYNMEEIIIGDFNVRPYNKKITSEKMLCSHRSLPHVYSQEKSRDITNRPMYNPTWRFFGRSGGALGTYYYSSPKYDAPWTIFDQVLVTNGLTYSGEDAVELITEIDQYRLIKDPPKCIPNKKVGSDHLPVVARIVHEAEISAD